LFEIRNAHGVLIGKARVCFNDLDTDGDQNRKITSVIQLSETYKRA
jgi:hypothetical protein